MIAFSKEPMCFSFIYMRAEWRKSKRKEKSVYLLYVEQSRCMFEWVLFADLVRDRCVWSHSLCLVRAVIRGVRFILEGVLQKHAVPIFRMPAWVIQRKCQLFKDSHFHCEEPFGLNASNDVWHSELISYLTQFQST